MASYNAVLTTILLVLGAIFLIFLIIICVKLMYTADKMNIILTDVEKKLKSVDGVFDTIDHVTGAVGAVSDVVVNKIIDLLNKMFSKKLKEKKKDE